MGKVKNKNVIETIEVFVLQNGIYSQVNKYMKIYVYKRSMLFWPLIQDSNILIIWNISQKATGPVVNKF